VADCSKSSTGAHYWIISGQNGAKVPGKCKYCGEERLFKNTFEPEGNPTIGKYRYRDPISERARRDYG